MLIVITSLFYRNDSVYIASFGCMDWNQVNFNSERNSVSTEQLDLQHILAMDPNNSGDGVLERTASGLAGC